MNIVQYVAEVKKPDGQRMAGYHEAQLDSLKQKLKYTPVRKQKDILSQIDETESKLALLKARRGALDSVSQFMESASQPSGLLSHIETLERSVSTGGSTSATRSGR